MGAQHLVDYTQPPCTAILPIVFKARYNKEMNTHHGAITLYNKQKIIVNTQDQYVCNRIRRYGVWEKKQVALLQHLIRPGFHIIEWGANYGAHTLFMAQKVGPTGHVWAFEPNPQVYPY